jgi:hypothetical protein
MEFYRSIDEKCYSYSNKSQKEKPLSVLAIKDKVTSPLCDSILEKH